MRLLYLEQNDQQSGYSMGLEFLENLRSYTSMQIFSLDVNQIYRDGESGEVFRQISEHIYVNKIDIVFLALDHRIILTIEDLRSINTSCFLACYLGDDEHYGPVFYNTYCQCFDVVFVSNYFPVEKYRAMGVDSIFLPSSYLLPAESKLPRENYQYDISFVGAISGKKDRLMYINALREHGFSVALLGGESTDGPLDRKDMYEVFRQTKINLNFTGIATGKIQDRNFQSQRRFKQIKGRSQEIALAGGFVLTEDAYGIDQLFTPGRELAVFKDTDDLVKKCEYYLRNDSARGKIAAEGHRRAVATYTSDRVWERFEKDIAKLHSKWVATEKFVCADDAFYQYYNAQLLSRAICLLSAFKIKTAYGEIRRLRLSYGFRVALTLRVIKRGWLSRSNIQSGSMG